jgi:two-component system LytT family response regulator
LVIDDEAPARSRLRHLLAGEPDVEVIAECSSGREAVSAIHQHQPDAVFLDIQMPRMTGLQVCEEVGVAQLPLVVFVTAYDQYAVKAFEVHAVDYLLKPVDRERFQGTLARLRERLGGNERSGQDVNLAAVLAELRSVARTTERMAFKVDGKVILLRRDEISWLEADGNYVHVHVGSESHMLRDTLANLETQLPADQFLRVSRSVIVNLDAVKELQPLFYGDYAVILRDGKKLTLSRSHRDRVERLLGRGGKTDSDNERT